MSYLPSWQETATFLGGGGLWRSHLFVLVPLSDFIPPGKGPVMLSHTIFLGLFFTRSLSVDLYHHGAVCLPRDAPLSRPPCRSHLLAGHLSGPAAARTGLPPRVHRRVPAAHVRQSLRLPRVPDPRRADRQSPPEPPADTRYRSVWFGFPARPLLPSRPHLGPSRARWHGDGRARLAWRAPGCQSRSHRTAGAGTHIVSQRRGLARA